MECFSGGWLPPQTEASSRVVMHWVDGPQAQWGPGSALGSPTSLQASPGPVCKVGTLSLCSGRVTFLYNSAILHGSNINHAVNSATMSKKSKTSFHG